jgi:hypothetical protein
MGEWLFYILVAVCLTRITILITSVNITAAVSESTCRTLVYRIGYAFKRERTICITGIGDTDANTRITCGTVRRPVYCRENQRENESHETKHD